MDASGRLGELVQNRRDAILEIAHRRGARRVRVFGSVARREDHAASDLDLLVDLVPGTDLFDIVAIKLDLEELLGRKVHVVTEEAVRPSMRDAIVREAVPL